MSSFNITTKYVSSPWPFQLAYNGGPKGHRYMLNTFKKGPISMSGRSQFSSQISRQKFFHNGPRFLQNGCKTVFSFKFLLPCRLKMKNWIWAFAEARFEKHPLNHSLAHSLNFSSPFPDPMRHARKNQLSGVLYFILYIPWGCLE